MAVTDWAADIVTEHVVAVPEHAPPQPTSETPEGVLAVSVTTEPWAK
jgi:hypothetical protein